MKKIMLNPYVLGVLAVISIVIFWFGWSTLKGWLAKLTIGRKLKAYQGSSYGVNTINPVEVAYVVHDAFYGRLWGLVEDERDAMDAIIKVPKPLIPSVAKAYGKIDGKNMYNDFVSYLSKDDYQKVKDLFI